MNKFFTEENYSKFGPISFISMTLGALMSGAGLFYIFSLMNGYVLQFVTDVQLWTLGQNGGKLVLLGALVFCLGSFFKRKENPAIADLLFKKDGE